MSFMIMIIINLEWDVTAVMDRTDWLWIHHWKNTSYIYSELSVMFYKKWKCPSHSRALAPLSLNKMRSQLVKNRKSCDLPGWILWPSISDVKNKGERKRRTNATSSQRLFLHPNTLQPLRNNSRLPTWSRRTLNGFV